MSHNRGRYALLNVCNYLFTGRSTYSLLPWQPLGATRKQHMLCNIEIKNKQGAEDLKETEQYSTALCCWIYRLIR